MSQWRSPLINIRRLPFIFLFALLTASSTCIAAAKVPAFRQETTKEPAEKIKKRNRLFGISVESVLQRQRQNQKLFLVDIRNRESYDKIRIPGAINLSLDAVKAKTFLKTHPVILVHEGYGYSRMERECKVLRTSGFLIRILNGGLNDWQAHGGPMEGDPFARNTLNKMPPRVFYLEKDFRDWMIIDAASVPYEASQSLIPLAAQMPVLNDPAGALQKLKTVAGIQKNDPFLSVLIFNETGADYDRIEKTIKKTGLKNVFYLSGGFEGYQRFIHHLWLSWKPKQDRTKTINKCKPCKEQLEKQPGK